MIGVWINMTTGIEGYMVAVNIWTKYSGQPGKNYGGRPFEFANVEMHPSSYQTLLKERVPIKYIMFQIIELFLILKMRLVFFHTIKRNV